MKTLTWIVLLGFIVRPQPLAYKYDGDVLVTLVKMIGIYVFMYVVVGYHYGNIEQGHI